MLQRQRLKAEILRRTEATTQENATSNKTELETFNSGKWKVSPLYLGCENVNSSDVANESLQSVACRKHGSDYCALQMSVPFILWIIS
jgi:hypothetical protein